MNGSEGGWKGAVFQDLALFVLLSLWRAPALHLQCQRNIRAQTTSSLQPQTRKMGAGDVVCLDVIFSFQSENTSIAFVEIYRQQYSGTCSRATYL